MNPDWPFAATWYFWLPVLLFAVVAIGLSWDWYRLNKREKLQAPNTWREQRTEAISTAHLVCSFEDKAAKGFKPKFVKQPDRRQGPKIH